MGEGGVALGGCWEVVGEDETAEGISGKISTVRIKFTLYTCRKVSGMRQRMENVLRTPSSLAVRPIPVWLIRPVT